MQCPNLLAEASIVFMVTLDFLPVSLCVCMCVSYTLPGLRKPERCSCTHISGKTLTEKCSQIHAYNS